MPLIQVSVNQDQIAINPVQIELAAARILNALGYTDAELSIAIVDDEEMTRLNREYRRIDSTTDVLAFPMLEGEFSDVNPELLGDVVISAPTAHAMSESAHRSFAAVLNLLLVHGILHLIGYDHEVGETAARAMSEKTLELLQLLGYTEEGFGWYFDAVSDLI
ncbi:MAG: rRNA maturation RNase YbeY [Deltaproteobacteria bacterium]|nr:rRNA maturation RNase YbeY [Deltaproteobacteria bacterium]